MNIARKIAAPLRRLWRREDGNATIEFAILFPVLITMFLMSVELGVLLTRGVMLDRAVDISVRKLRLGTLSPMTAAGLKAEICKNSVIIKDCTNVLTVELRPISTTTWTPLNGAATCVDRSSPIKPVLDFIPGQKNKMMLVRVCSLFDPFFPTGGLAAQIVPTDHTGAYAMVSMSAYVNEP